MEFEGEELEQNLWELKVLENNAKSLGICLSPNHLALGALHVSVDGSISLSFGTTDSTTGEKFKFNNFTNHTDEFEKCMTEFPCVL